jgi:hypothetical protein
MPQLLHFLLPVEILFNIIAMKLGIVNFGLVGPSSWHGAAPGSGITGTRQAPTGTKPQPRYPRAYAPRLRAKGFSALSPTLASLWGPRLTTRDSRYAYNSRSQETVVNPHNRVGISDYIIHYITSIKVLHKPLG